MRILLIEDEKKVASFIERGLKEQKYIVDTAENGEDGLFIAQVNSFDLIILDVMLPSIDGFSVCRQLRKNHSTTPILMLTARDSIKDKVMGLDLGADDYLTKPFDFQEFLARVRVLLRRDKNQKGYTLKIDDLVLDQLTHQVTRSGKTIDLTGTEYSLLEYLMLHANQLVTRTMISEHVWGHDFDSFSNVINVYINYLRNKIDKDFSHPLLHSVRGSGYILKS